jgi:Sporulation and spore germination
MIPRNLAIAIAVLLLAVLAMGLYGLRLRHRALELQERANEARPVAPPVSGATENITIFEPNDDHGSLVRRTISARLPSEPSLRAREIVRLLIDSWQQKNALHTISASADVNEVFLLDNNKSAVVDVNAAFADQHRSGILVEELTMAALSRTLGANMPGLTQLKFIVDGHQRETLAGHADLTTFYSTSLDWPTE